MLALMLLASCSSKKDIVYLQDMRTGTKYPIETKYEPVIHGDDLLGITVSCKNPELAIPFNVQGGTFSVDADDNVTSDGSGNGGKNGYRVDVNGNIDFPILGKLHIEGMTVNDVKELIANKIEEGNYMKDPLVSIEFLNFKYTVLGAVGRNGTFTAKGDRVTILDAIANAGDLSVNAEIDRVAVSEETVEAVERALCGEDESAGALYFVAPAYADAGNHQWFRDNLTLLFSYEGHEFYA